MTHELNPNVQFRSLIGDLGDTIDEAILHAMESTASDQLLATLAEARGGIVRMTHAVKVVTIAVVGENHNAQLPQGAQPKALPKVQPQRWPEKQRPGIGPKLKSPKAFDCPACLAEAGTNCFVYSSQGKHGKVTDQRNTGSTYHSARQALSRAANDRIRQAYDREQAKAQDHGE